VIEVIGSPHFIWETKLKSLRAAIKHWAKENAAKENKKGAELHRKMEQWNQEKEDNQFSKEDQLRENEMYRELYKQNREDEEEQRRNQGAYGLELATKILHSSTTALRSNEPETKLTK